MDVHPLSQCPNGPIGQLHIAGCSTRAQGRNRSIGSTGRARCNPCVTTDRVDGFAGAFSSGLGYHTIWLFNSPPWNITMLLIGKPSISIRAIEKPWLC